MKINPPKLDNPSIPKLRIEINLLHHPKLKIPADTTSPKLAKKTQSFTHKQAILIM